MLIMGSPFLGGTFAPTQVRAGLTLLLALLLAPSIATPAEITGVGLVLVVAREVAIGIALALGVRLISAVAEFAGQLTGYQVGLSYGSIVDPQSGVANSTIATIYSSLTIVLCFATNVHHAWLRALAASYQALPIGIGAIDTHLGTLTASMLGMVFVFGTQLAAPVIVVMLLVEVVMGLATRIAPSLNMMVIGAPARMPIGLLVVAFTVTAMPTLVSKFAPAALRLAVETARAFR